MYRLSDSILFIMKNYDVESKGILWRVRLYEKRIYESGVCQESKAVNAKV